MSDIPRARMLLEEALGIDNLAVVKSCIRDALALMTRPPIASRRVAPPRSAPVTPELVFRIKRMAAASPNLSLQDLGALVGTNAGRVSEVLTGRRDDSGRLVG